MRVKFNLLADRWRVSRRLGKRQKIFSVGVKNYNLRDRDGLAEKRTPYLFRDNGGPKCRVYTLAGNSDLAKLLN